MIARDRRVPIGGTASLRKQDHRGSLSILLGIECLVERPKHTGVIRDINLEAANIDIRKSTQHDRQDSRDGVALVVMKGSAAGSVDGPGPGSKAGSALTTAFDAPDGGKTPRRYVPISFGPCSRDVAGCLG